LDQSTDSGLVTTKRQHVLRVSTLCASQPGDVVTVSIALTAFDNITIQYYKQCQVNTPRIGLSVSTNDWFAGGPPANVAIDGMVMDRTLITMQWSCQVLDDLFDFFFVAQSGWMIRLVPISPMTNRSNR
jgi:hypothetical protein